MPGRAGSTVIGLATWFTMTESSPKPGTQDGLAFERPLTDLQQKIAELRKLNSGSHLELAGEIELLEERLRRQTAEVYAQLSPW